MFPPWWMVGKHHSWQAYTCHMDVVCMLPTQPVLAQPPVELQPSIVCGDQPWPPRRTTCLGFAPKCSEVGPCSRAVKVGHGKRATNKFCIGLYTCCKKQFPRLTDWKIVRLLIRCTAFETQGPQFTGAFFAARHQIVCFNGGWGLWWARRSMSLR